MGEVGGSVDERNVLEFEVRISVVGDLGGISSYELKKIISI